MTFYENFISVSILAPGTNQSTNQVTHLVFLYTFFGMNAHTVHRSGAMQD
jgi:hypothetical protein